MFLYILITDRHVCQQSNIATSERKTGCVGGCSELVIWGSLNINATSLLITVLLSDVFLFEDSFKEKLSLLSPVGREGLFRKCLKSLEKTLYLKKLLTFY